MKYILQATKVHKNSWTRTTDNRVFTKVLYGIIKFVEMVVFPSMTGLLLDQIPQILRNKLYRDSSHYYLLLTGFKTCFPFISFDFDMFPWEI